MISAETDKYFEKVKKSKIFNRVLRELKLNKIFTSFFSPHIYLVAENAADFRYPDKKIKEWEGDDYYKELINIAAKQ